MMHAFWLRISLLPTAWGALELNANKTPTNDSDLSLTYAVAVELASLPLGCIRKESPHYPGGLTYGSKEDIVRPSKLHPIFYGCMDWHSAVHGHWAMATLANKFPGTELEKNVADAFDEQFRAEKVAKEKKLFDSSANKYFERTYGWAWLLKLHEELKKSSLDAERGWSSALKPLADKFLEGFRTLLKALVYTNRSGEYGNTAFALIYLLEHAQTTRNTDLADQIGINATKLYANDVNCRLDWEPSGNDFLSPCLQEADLMATIMKRSNYIKWLRRFLPQMFDGAFWLEPFTRTSFHYGHQSHLDGLNFSRAWNLYSIIAKLPAELDDVRLRLFALGDRHVRASIDAVLTPDYFRSHWLGTFLLRALEMREKAKRSLGIDSELL